MHGVVRKKKKNLLLDRSVTADATFVFFASGVKSEVCESLGGKAEGKVCGNNGEEMRNIWNRCPICPFLLGKLPL